MRDEDIFSTLAEKNREVVKKKKAVHVRILKQRTAISEELTHFELLKKKNRSIHEERINKIKNTLHP